MVDFSPEEKRIINVLYYAHKPLTTKMIAERSEMAWQTAKKYLEKLYQKQKLRRAKKGKSIYWWIRVN